MKNILLILFLSLLSLPSLAQKINFGDSTNRWKVFHFICGTDPCVVDLDNYYYGSDTTIHDTLYKTLGDPYSVTAFIREDTLIHKVFAISPLIYSDTAEKLMYDYTLQVGDTFKSSVAIHHVDSLDSVSINSVWHKVWHFKLDTCISCTGWLCFSYYVIEGVGSTTLPITPIKPRQFEGGDKMTCFTNEGTIPPLSKMIDTFDNTTSCSLTFNLATNNLVNKLSIATVFPNPVYNLLTIKSSTTIYSINVINLLGQILYTHNYNSPQVQIDVADLPSGIYFIKINGSEVRKFVKE